MKSSWRIGRLAGIDIYLHVTLLILLGWVVVSHYLQRQNWIDAWSGLAFTVSLFSIIVLHELGHALAARRFGIRTREITLLPIGGVARLERIPEKPREELLVSLAGPAVNVVLAAVLFAVLAVGSEPSAAREFKLVGGHFLAKLFWVNVSLAVFNLLPAFPMDGGRVLRALLAMRMDYVRATHIAASIGQGMAAVFGFIGLFSNPFLIFVALFVWIGAAQEAGMAQMKSGLAGLPVSRVMMTDFRALDVDDKLARAVEHILSGSQHDFPVVDDGQVVGVLTRNDLMTALAKRGPEANVADVMRHEVCPAEADELVELVLARRGEADCAVLPVYRQGQLVGLLSGENIGEYLMIQAALDEVSRGRSG